MHVIIQIVDRPKSRETFLTQKHGSRIVYFSPEYSVFKSIFICHLAKAPETNFWTLFVGFRTTRFLWGIEFVCQIAYKKKMTAPLHGYTDNEYSQSNHWWKKVTNS